MSSGRNDIAPRRFLQLLRLPFFHRMEVCLVVFLAFLIRGGAPYLWTALLILVGILVIHRMNNQPNPSVHSSLSIHASIYILAYLSVCPFLHHSVHLSLFLSILQSIFYLSVCPHIHLSTCSPVEFCKQPNIVHYKAV